MLCVLIRIASSGDSNGAKINPQCLELLVSRTISHGTKDVRAIEVRLYSMIFLFMQGTTQAVRCIIFMPNC